MSEYLKSLLHEAEELKLPPEPQKSIEHREPQELQALEEHKEPNEPKELEGLKLPDIFGCDEETEEFEVQEAGKKTNKEENKEASKEANKEINIKMNRNQGFQKFGGTPEEDNYMERGIRVSKPIIPNGA